MKFFGFHDEFVEYSNEWQELSKRAVSERAKEEKEAT